ncbi:ATP-binding cassette domain-containing protein [Streptomyces europaeiscabiei]|uniref:ATP-binding cassette domain-containing protein n=1 Tax=Streptomyces europaeiscabiei TaxID=146819 RepID=UPI0030E30E11
MTIALTGRNGAGKSTLLSALVGLVEPAAGSVRVGGLTPHRTAPKDLVRRVGLVPQEPRDLLYTDTVAAECAAADRDAGAEPGTCRGLASGLLPGIGDDTHPPRPAGGAAAGPRARGRPHGPPAAAPPRRTDPGPRLPMFFLMVLSGRVLGPGFGFTLGAVTMFSSALLTGGVGPWMPFQMLSMGWFAMGAGLLPGAHRLRGRTELVLLAAYGFVAAFAYGTVMNLYGWPFIDTLASNIAFDESAAPAANLARFVAYCLATSLGWDLGRAVVTVVLTLTLTLGTPVLKALRRATRRAAFESAVTFTPPTR